MFEDIIQLVIVSKEIKKRKKVELHRHLEGCIDKEFLENHLKSYFPTHNLLENDNIGQLFNYSNFMDFLTSWATVMDLLTDVEHFRDLTQYTINQLNEENIVYEEMIFSPQPFVMAGLDYQQLLEIIHEEFSKNNVETKLIIDFVRNFGAKSMTQSLQELIQIRKKNDNLENWIKAVSIGGDELNYPANLFKSPFKLARDNGLNMYAHAGEWSGTQNIWDTINNLKVERIGHGINSINDINLLDYLRENQIGLDISITSNYLTNAVDDGEIHPVKELHNHDIKITINTDDPGFFHTDLNLEYQKLMNMGFNLDDISAILQNTIDVTFLDTDEKEQLRRQLK